MDIGSSRVKLLPNVIQVRADGHLEKVMALGIRCTH